MELAAVGLAIAGWLALHLLQIRALRKNLINQIRNDGRKQIAEALREYQDWCSKVSTRLSGLELSFLNGMPVWSDERWRRVLEELHELFWNDATTQWIFAIEENEILFPQLKRPRQQLSDCQAEISKSLSAFMFAIRTPSERLKAIQDAQGVVERLREQSALVEYLHVAVQNIALGQIVGRRRAMPGPRDVSLVRLIAKGSRLEFGLGRPVGRVALAWRRMRHGHFRGILDEHLPDQRALFQRLIQVAEGKALPESDWWIQGEAQRMAVQILDARSGRELWLRSGTPDQIATEFASWVNTPQALPPKESES